MNTEMISISSYCLKYEVERTFIDSLEEGGLIEMIRVENEQFISYADLPRLEKYIRWHYEFEINREGIETIQHLLYKLDGLQKELATLKNRLRVYERD